MTDGATFVVAYRLLVGMPPGCDGVDFELQHIDEEGWCAYVIAHGPDVHHYWPPESRVRLLGLPLYHRTQEAAVAALETVFRMEAARISREAQSLEAAIVELLRPKLRAVAN